MHRLPPEKFAPSGKGNQLLLNSLDPPDWLTRPDPLKAHRERQGLGFLETFVYLSQPTPRYRPADLE